MTTIMTNWNTYTLIYLFLLVLTYPVSATKLRSIDLLLVLLAAGLLITGFVKQISL